MLCTRFLSRPPRLPPRPPLSSHPRTPPTTPTQTQIPRAILSPLSSFGHSPYLLPVVLLPGTNERPQALAISPQHVTFIHFIIPNAPHLRPPPGSHHPPLPSHQPNSTKPPPHLFDTNHILDLPLFSTFHNPSSLHHSPPMRPPPPLPRASTPLPHPVLTTDVYPIAISHTAHHDRRITRPSFAPHLPSLHTPPPFPPPYLAYSRRGDLPTPFTFPRPARTHRGHSPPPYSSSTPTPRAASRRMGYSRAAPGSLPPIRPRTLPAHLATHLATSSTRPVSPSHPRSIALDRPCCPRSARPRRPCHCRHAAPRPARPSARRRGRRARQPRAPATPTHRTLNVLTPALHGHSPLSPTPEPPRHTSSALPGTTAAHRFTCAPAPSSHSTPRPTPSPYYNLPLDHLLLGPGLRCAHPYDDRALPEPNLHFAPPYPRLPFQALTPPSRLTLSPQALTRYTLSRPSPSPPTSA